MSVGNNFMIYTCTEAPLGHRPEALDASDATKLKRPVKGLPGFSYVIPSLSPPKVTSSVFQAW